MQIPGLQPETPTTLEALVERVTYENPESGWSVLRVTPSKGGSAVVVGRLAGISPGESLRLTGSWVTDRKYGRQFRADSFLSIEPKTLAGIERYLGSGLLPGIGKVMAKRLVGRFADETLRILDSEPQRLAEIPGIGTKRRAKIIKAWKAQRAVRDVLIFLQTHGISIRFASKILKKYDTHAVAVVKKDPFRLAEDIPGIGFAAADRIAESLGLANDSLERASAGVLFAIRQAATQGHLFQYQQTLIDAAVEILTLEPSRIEGAIDALAERQGLAREKGDPRGTRLYLPELHAAELGIASDTDRIRSSRDKGLEIDVERALAWFESREAVQLAPIQRRAIELALTENLLVITGGPGTGKTTLINGVVAILRRKRQQILLAAPTGRAAKRLQEATGAEVKTVHRLLEYDPHLGGFRRHRDRPLEADLVIVDEASMLDAQLAQSLLEAVPDGTRLVLVGDIDQLPSVGPGQVLGDLISSGAISVVRLEEVFRQAQASQIVLNAHRIQRGAKPLTSEDPDSDFFFIQRNEPQEILDTLLHLVAQRIPKGFSLDPANDIQVLTPMRRGLLGTENLNRELQELLNADGRPTSEGGRLRISDRVMQIRNNYDLEVFNGDIGRVRSSHREDRRVIVSFDGRLVEYRASDIDELVLAYATTVHKSQGSEYPCVILPLHTQHFVMLQRNLLYTAVTRARDLMVLLGDSRALDIAVRNQDQKERLSGLAERLRRRK
ncbi:MAG: ATP-dependent RecD-like DNA helicase [Acidobacteriota bacterium]|nr:ATP-dependent RecD-like DNA helicase [Acidobacteriota bacterium]